MYTIPIHNNPRGTTLPAARRRRLLALAAQYDFLVLADEVYQVGWGGRQGGRGGGLWGAGGREAGGREAGGQLHARAQPRG